jgi:hypothetical protein
MLLAEMPLREAAAAIRETDSDGIEIQARQHAGQCHRRASARVLGAGRSGAGRFAAAYFANGLGRIAGLAELVRNGSLVGRKAASSVRVEHAALPGGSSAARADRDTAGEHGGAGGRADVEGAVPLRHRSVGFRPSSTATRSVKADW